MALPTFGPSTSGRCSWFNGILQELWESTDLLFHSKLTWLLMLGPVALFGDATGIFGEALCFACSGIALIPCAERLSFVTEQVASHTNGTIGALLNATFGNAPELLISTAALRAGFYRVVQLAMLGSMLTNLLFVFGMSCLVGGLRWQVQELRITSGNVSVGMLLVATAGSLLPAALAMSNEMKQSKEDRDGVPSDSELTFCRVNALVMMMMYIFYLLFQLGTHKEEFDEDENIVETPEHLLLMTPHFTSRRGHKNHKAKRNKFCLKCLVFGSNRHAHQLIRGDSDSDLGMAERSGPRHAQIGSKDEVEAFIEEEGGSQTSSLESNPALENGQGWGSRSWPASPLSPTTKRRVRASNHSTSSDDDVPMRGAVGLDPRRKSSGPDRRLGENDDDSSRDPPEAQMSLRIGVVWLFIITLCISAMSDILVDSIDGFAYRCHLSEVFTSMVIVPFFSNVAEQVSAILFAYRNEMDLCVGVTVGSAIQIATFVLPGCVLIGTVVDRSMSLYFRGYETCCLFLAVVTVAAVLQGGTTNWLVGTTLIGIYTMIAAGFWFHEIEDLSTDAELLFQNKTDGVRVLTMSD